MAVLAECDICGNQHRLKEAAVGRSIRCKACGVQIDVSAENTISPASFIEESGRLRRLPSEQPISPWTWFLIGLVTITLVGLMIGVVALCAAFFRFTPKQIVRSSFSRWTTSAVDGQGAIKPS